MTGSLAPEISRCGPSPWPRTAGTRPIWSVWRSFARSASAALLLAGVLSAVQVVPTHALLSSATVTMTAQFAMCSSGDDTCDATSDNALQAVVLAAPPAAVARIAAPGPLQAVPQLKTSAPTATYPSTSASRSAAQNWR